MGKTLTLELPEEMFDAIGREASARGTTPAEWVVGEIRERLPASPPQPAEPPLPPLSEILAKIAPQMGLTLEEMTRQWKERYGAKPPPVLSDEERRAAEEELRRHIGAVSLGHPTGTDNESIDADLAREYGRGLDR